MLTVATLMQSHPKTVPADMPLTTLERLFMTSGFAGFPVVDGKRLIGVVTRSDIVRSMITERSHAEQVSEFYSTTRPTSPEEEKESLDAIAARVGVRIAGLRVEDAMIRTVVSVDASEPITRLAETMLDGHLHRLPVVDGDDLVGLITSLDLVRAIKDGLLVESPEAVASHQLLLESSNE